MIENSENELSKKQEYLRIEIMEKGIIQNYSQKTCKKKKAKTL